MNWLLTSYFHSRKESRRKLNSSTNTKERGHFPAHPHRQERRILTPAGPRVDIDTTGSTSSTPGRHTVSRGSAPESGEADSEGKGKQKGRTNSDSEEQADKNPENKKNVKSVKNSTSEILYDKTVTVTPSAGRCSGVASMSEAASESNSAHESESDSDVDNVGRA
jgi:hypothetical protein